MIPINIVAEDFLSEAIMKKLLALSGKAFHIATIYNSGGNGYIQKKASAFNSAAKGVPYFILTDLDNKACAPSLISTWLNGKSQEKYLIFRVAVCEVESWILADDENFSKFLGVAKNKIPADPDKLKDPKQTLINFARNSRFKKLADRIVPIQGSGALQGPDYNGALIEFIDQHWDLAVALSRSESLVRAYDKICNFTYP